jgi:hypothetical protein
MAFMRMAFMRMPFMRMAFMHTPENSRRPARHLENRRTPQQS